MMIRNFIVVLAIMLMLFSCNHAQSKLDNAADEIEYAEKNKKDLSEQDWADLKMMMEELEADYELNKDKYNDAQIREFGKIQGRYTALVVKKGLSDFQETVKDLGKQMEGFIDGVKSDTNSNNN
jgi:hypothetical protein